MFTNRKGGNWGFVDIIIIFIDNLKNLKKLILQLMDLLRSQITTLIKQNQPYISS